MKHVILTLTAALALTAGSASASSGHHWGYSGEAGPAHWATLNPAFAICGGGVNQSPINLTGFVEAELAPMEFHYSGLATEILNNGHTIQVNYTTGSTVRIDGRRFMLKQFHFHSPSENQINGKYFPMEAHFVHADAAGNLAVIALMFKVGEENKEITKLWQQMPASEGTKIGLASRVRAEKLMPEDTDYYRFNGSLTTPPCTEGVVWAVLKQSVTLSEKQLNQFITVMGHPNNRPVQPVNARPVLE